MTHNRIKSGLFTSIAKYMKIKILKAHNLLKTILYFTNKLSISFKNIRLIEDYCQGSNLLFEKTVRRGCKIEPIKIVKANYVQVLLFIFHSIFILLFSVVVKASIEPRK